MQAALLSSTALSVSLTRATNTQPRSKIAITSLPFFFAVAIEFSLSVGLKNRLRQIRLQGQTVGVHLRGLAGVARNQEGTGEVLGRGCRRGSQLQKIAFGLFGLHEHAVDPVGPAARDDGGRCFPVPHERAFVA